LIIQSSNRYQLADIRQKPPNGRNLYIFHYDWRQDNVYNAQRLNSFIEQVLNQHTDHQQVDVVAHSLGGLILRYYQRFGAQDVLSQIPSGSDHSSNSIFTNSQTHKVRHAILLGTPQLGTVKAIGRLQSGFDFNLRNIPVEVQITMPSVYQLLPHPLSSWAVNTSGEKIHVDVYNPTLWQKNQWSIYNPEIIERIIAAADNQSQGIREVKTLQHFFNQQLLRAEKFWLALSPTYEVEHEGFIVMGGSCNETLNRLIVEYSTQSTDLYKQLILRAHLDLESEDLELQKSILFEPGDGQVSKSSLLGQIQYKNSTKKLKTVKVKYPVFVCEDHVKLTKNATFQDNLLHVLLNN